MVWPRSWPPEPPVSPHAASIAPATTAQTPLELRRITSDPQNPLLGAFPPAIVPLARTGAAADRCREACACAGGAPEARWLRALGVGSLIIFPLHTFRSRRLRSSPHRSRWVSFELVGPADQFGLQSPRDRYEVLHLRGRRSACCTPGPTDRLRGAIRRSAARHRRSRNTRPRHGHRPCRLPRHSEWPARELGHDGARSLRSRGHPRPQANLDDGRMPTSRRSRSYDHRRIALVREAGGASIARARKRRSPMLAQAECHSSNWEIEAG